MNRKISTLLTAGLLVAGSLCGSAFAQTPTVSIKNLTGIGSTVANELKNGARYVMVDASSSLAYGHEISTTTGKIVEVGEAINTPIFYDDSDSKDGVKKYIWTVSVTEAPRGFFSYTLTNAETGKSLRYNSAYNAIETDPAAKAEVPLRISCLRIQVLSLLLPLVRSILPLISTWLPIKRVRLFGTVCHGLAAHWSLLLRSLLLRSMRLNPRNLRMLPS